MMASRRDFLKGMGALVVSLSPALKAAAQGAQEGQFGTHASHIDPDKLDSWIAVNADKAKKLPVLNETGDAYAGAEERKKQLGF